MKTKLFLLGLLLAAGRILYAQFPDDLMSWHMQRSYTELGARHLFSLTQFILGDVRADNAEVGGAYGGEIPSLEEIMLFEAGEDNPDMQAYWFRGYTLLSHCNALIDSIAESGLPEDIQTRYIAEAKFVRALTLFTLANTYGAIPAPTESFYWPMGGMLIDYEIMNKVPGPVLSLFEVYEIVEADLEAAIPILPIRSAIGSEEYFRATKGAALALLGKVRLFASSFASNYPDDARFEGFTERWNEALTVLETLINSGEYALIDGEFDTYWSAETPAYRALFSTQLNGCEEMVFSLKNLELGNGYSGFRGLAHTQFTTVRIVDFGSGPTNSSGWGVVAPNQDLIDAFAAGAGTAADDPRFWVTVGLEGDSIFLFEKWAKMVFPETGLIAANRKWECSPEEFWDVRSQWLDSPFEIPLIRYSDVLLMAAEAGLMQGYTAQPLEYINMIRMRASSSGTTGKPEMLSTVTLEDIMLERRVELALEGHRFFDLLRWGLLSETLDGRYIASSDQTISFEVGKDEFIAYADTLIGITGTYLAAEEQGSGLQLFPNPGNGLVKINTDVGIDRIHVYSLSGALLIEKDIRREESPSLDMTQLESGMYILQFHTDTGIHSRSYVKQ